MLKVSTAFSIFEISESVLFSIRVTVSFVIRSFRYSVSGSVRFAAPS